MWSAFIGRLFGQRKEKQAVPVPAAEPVLVVPAAKASKEDIERLIAMTADVIINEMRADIDVVKLQAKEFVETGRHLQGGALQDYRGMLWDKCLQRYRRAADAFTASQGEEAHACWQQAMSEADASRIFQSPDWLCVLLRNAFMDRHPGIDLLHSDSLERVFGELRKVESAWNKCFTEPVEADTRRGIRILRGSYGEYNDCIGYDDAFHVFVLFKPDDNYYHWGGYHIYPISRERAEDKLGRRLPEFPDPLDEEAAKQYYKVTSNDDIERRVITKKDSPDEKRD